MFCGKCGHENSVGAKFCAGCGTELSVEAMADMEPQKEPVKEEASRETIKTTPVKKPFVAPPLNKEEIGPKTSGTFIAPPPPPVAAKASPVIPPKKPFVAPSLEKKDGQRMKHAIKVEKKQMSLKKKIILIVVAVLCVAIGALYFVGKTLSNPERIVKQYFESVTSKDYDGAYACMDFESNEFTTKEMYAKVMENEYDEYEVDVLNYSVRENMTGDTLIKEYTVTYTETGRNDTGYMTISLVKQPDKKWLLFDDYKISANNLIAKNYIIRVNAAAEAYIDGIKIDEKYAETVMDADRPVGEKTYKIPSLFMGYHEIKVQTPFTEERILKEHIVDGSETYIYDMNLTEESKDGIKTMAKEFLEKFISSAIDKKSVDTLNSYFSQAARTDNIKDEYEDVAGYGVDENGRGIKRITLGEIEFDTDRMFDQDYGFCLSVSYKYNYVAQSLDWYTGEPEEYTSSSPSSASASIYFVYEDGAWKIQNVYVYM